MKIQLKIQLNLIEVSSIEVSSISPGKYALMKMYPLIEIRACHVLTQAIRSLRVTRVSPLIYKSLEMRMNTKHIGKF